MTDIVTLLLERATEWETRGWTDDATTAREAAIEIERLREPSKWRPIDTAPKNGLPIILYWPFITQDGFVTPGYWHDPGSDVAAYWYSDMVNGGATPPTHWMPLPMPPTSARGEG